MRRRIAVTMAAGAAFLIFTMANPCVKMTAEEISLYSASGSTGEETEGEKGKQTGPETDVSDENQTDPEAGGGDEKRTDPETDGGDEEQTDPEAGSGDEEQTDPEAGSGDEEQTDPEAGSGDEEQTDAETDGGDEKQTDAETDDTDGDDDYGDNTGFDRTLWTEEELSKKPKGKWIISVNDVKADLPEEGRYYDGTDKINVSFDTKAVSETSEETPAYRIECESRLDSADAGERKAVCIFTLKTPWPGRVKLDPGSERQEIKVIVKKALLHVRISDGVKKYGTSAEISNIDFGQAGILNITGFVTDEKGNPVIPYGFEPPEAEVNRDVLKKFSPVYETDLSNKNQNIVRKYNNAVVLKKKQGKITGNATENYEFCTDPDDPLCCNGTVTVERAEAVEGKEYEIYGYGGNVIKEGGTVIVRRGSSIRVRPLKDSGYSEEYESQPLVSDGTLSLRLQEKDGKGCLLADSLKISVQYRVDGSAPEAVISSSEPAHSGTYRDGILFSSRPVSFGYSIPEDDLSGIQSVRIRAVKSELGGEFLSDSLAGRPETAGSWQTADAAGTLTVSDEGIWRLEAEVTDRVGNTRHTSGPAVVIDKSPPEISVSGVRDGSANAGEVNLSASCSDSTYMSDTFSANLTSYFGGEAPSSEIISEDSHGAVLKFDPFPRTKNADAVYTLKVTASDLAGNSSEETISFSINRFGSSYGLSEGCVKELESYYHRKPFDIVFTETNISEVGRARVLMRKGRQLTELTPGKGVTVDSKVTDQGTHQYTYTVSAGTFDGDGNYEVMLLTDDAAGNSADSSSQKLPVRFAIDSTPPECLISGLEGNEIIKQESMTVAAQLRDNLELSSARVYINSVRNADYTGEQLAKNDGVIKILLHEGDSWQTLQIYAQDKAGNESWTEEIPFMMTSDEDMPVAGYSRTRLSAQQLALADSKLAQWRTKLEKTWKWARPVSSGRHSMEETGRNGGMLSPAGVAADGFLKEASGSKRQKSESNGHPAAIAIIAGIGLSIILVVTSITRAYPWRLHQVHRKDSRYKY